jgi:signal recognition particle subunit SEC65
MIDKKSSKSKGKKVRVIFGREKSEDHLVKAIRKMCKEAGIKFIPSQKKRKRNPKEGKI